MLFINLVLEIQISYYRFCIIVKFQMSSMRKSLALRVTNINVVSLERGSMVEYFLSVFPTGEIE